MDPTAGVIIATLITTVGLIVVAIINNRKERSQAAGAGVEAALDERDVLERMLALIADNERKEKIVQAQDTEIKAKDVELRALYSRLADLEGDETNDRTHAQ